MSFVKIPAGQFIMGTPGWNLKCGICFGSGKYHYKQTALGHLKFGTDRIARCYNCEGKGFIVKCFPSEYPPHQVSISNAFLIQTNVITQKQWIELMQDRPWRDNTGLKPGVVEGDNFPAVYISWENAQLFIKKLNRFEPGKGYRLPTEAEWEYACRAGSKLKYSFGNNDELFKLYSWYGENPEKAVIHKVGLKKPNSWGLFDMPGNVLNWCQDGGRFYTDEPQVDPINLSDPNTSDAEPLAYCRGVSFCSPVGECRLGFRTTSFRMGSNTIGFRLVCAAEGTPQKLQAEKEFSDYQNYIKYLAIKNSILPAEIERLKIQGLIDLVHIPGGTFNMGVDNMYAFGGDGHDDCRPVHSVKISSFLMSRFLVTQKQWVSINGNNSLTSSSPDYGLDAPAVNINWNDIQDFIQRMNSKSDALVFRLPTEAEWEYACRAGTSSTAYGPIHDIAWCYENSSERSHPVGQKKPNAFGLYDMLGNAYQWCSDWHETYEPPRRGEIIDPKGPSSGRYKVVRGGAFNTSADQLGSGFRFYNDPAAPSGVFTVAGGWNYRSVLGFRLVADYRPRSNNSKINEDRYTPVSLGQSKTSTEIKEIQPSKIEIVTIQKSPITAISDLSQAIEIVETNPDKAIQDFRKIISADSKNLGARAWLCVVLYNQHFTIEFIKELREARRHGLLKEMTERNIRLRFSLNKARLGQELPTDLMD